jgi:hypothetical protein
MIQAFTCRKDIDDKMLENRLGKLREGFHAIFLNQTKTLSFGDLYFIVYHLTLGHRGDAVHALVDEVVSEHARVCDSTERFWKHVKEISDVCMFLEQRHPPLDKNNKTLPSVVTIAARELSKRKLRAIDHLRRIAPLVGKIRLFLVRLHTHVHYKPDGLGEANAKAEFESTARLCTWDVHRTVQSI